MKILVAVDGSNNSLRAVKYAAKLAKDLRTKTSITLINVHDDDPLNFFKAHLGNPSIKDYLARISQKELKSALRYLGGTKIKHSAIIEFGHIVTTICLVLSKEKFDLIILGAKGRSSLFDATLGSTSQKVAALAKKPVMLIK